MKFRSTLRLKPKRVPARLHRKCCSYTNRMETSSGSVETKRENMMGEKYRTKSEQKKAGITGFHRRWSNRQRVNEGLRRWLHLMDAVVAKMRGTRYASWSARCIIRRWRQWTRRRVAIELKIGRDRANLIHFHTRAIERVQANAEDDLMGLCKMFALLLQGEEDRDTFLDAARRFFGRRDKHLQMLTNSVARLMHLNKEAKISIDRNLPGAKPVRPLLVTRLATFCYSNTSPTETTNVKNNERNHDQVIIDTSTLSTYIQNRQKTDIEDLCSALKRALNGSIDKETFQNMCFVYSGKVQTYTEIAGTLIDQSTRGKQQDGWKDNFSDRNEKDIEIASTSSILTKDSWM